MRKGKYRLHNFIFDAIMISFTAGLWVVWIFVREHQISRGVR